MLIHHEEFGDRLLGVLAGYLLYAGLVTEGPHAVVVIEKITGRQLGAIGARDRRGDGRRGDRGELRPTASRRGAEHDGHDRHRRACASSACTACSPRSRRARSRSRSTSSSPSTSTAAGESDALDDTVDYSAVAEAVSRVVHSERYHLLERLATRIAEVCRVDERVTAVAVTVRKLHPPVRAMVDHVAVRIEQ